MTSCGAQMIEPLSRNAREGLASKGGSMWFSHGCTIGCTTCNDTGVPVVRRTSPWARGLFDCTHDLPLAQPPHFPDPVAGTKPSPNIGGYYGDGCPNDHSRSKKPTIMDPELTTMNAQEDQQSVGGRPWTQWHPWRAPGSTTPLDPCGVAGGARTNMSFRAGGFGPETGYPQGFNGSSLPAIPKAQRKTYVQLPLPQGRLLSESEKELLQVESGLDGRGTRSSSRCVFFPSLKSSCYRSAGSLSPTMRGATPGRSAEPANRSPRTASTRSPCSSPPTPPSCATCSSRRYEFSNFRRINSIEFVMFVSRTAPSARTGRK